MFIYIYKYLYNCKSHVCFSLYDLYNRKEISMRIKIAHFSLFLITFYFGFLLFK